MTSVPRDANRVPGLLAGSSGDSGDTPIVVYVDPNTHRLLVDIDAADVTTLTGVMSGGTVNAADKGLITMGIRSDALATISADDGEYTALRTGPYGDLWVSLATKLDKANDEVLVWANTAKDGTGTDYVPLVDADGHLQVDVLSSGALTVAATNLDIRDLTSASDSVEAKQATGTNLHTVVDSGTITTITNAVTVNSHAVTNAGTFAVQVDGSALTALQLIDDVVKAEDTGHTTADKGVFILGVRNDGNAEFAGTDADYTPLAVDGSGSLRIIGNVAHDAGDGGNPIKVGMKAIAHGTNPTAVAANDRTDWYANRAGVPFVMGGHPNVLTKNLNVTDADGAQTNADIIGAIGAGTKYVVTHITVTADNANTVDVAVRIGFGAASTPAADAAGIILAHPGIAPGSGVSIGNGGGIIGVGGDGEELRVTCEDPVTGSIDIVVGYYTIES